MPGPFQNFGQALVNGAIQTYPVTFPIDSVVSMSKGTIAFWAKLNNYPNDLFDWSNLLTPVSPSPGPFRIGFASNDGLGGGGLFGTFGTGSYNSVETATETYWSGGQLDSILGNRAAWHHYALVWNEAGIPQLGGRKVYLFLDGKLLSTPYYQDFSPWGTVPKGFRFALANFNNISGASIAVDNLIIWDDVKTDFSDRFDENPGVVSNCDVRVSAKVTASGFIYSRSTKTYHSTVYVKNTGSQYFNGPVSVVFKNLPAGVSLVNPSGTSLGSPYAVIPSLSAAQDVFAPNQTVSFPVQFNATVPINFSNTVCSGSLKP